jgi:putative ABC transport system substrate-binding protein
MNKFIYLTIIYMLSFHASVAAAWDVLVVQSFRAKPYAEALRGFRTSCNATVHELVISELNGEDVAAEVRRRKPDLILAMGMDALLKVRKIKEKPVVYLMVLNPDSALHGENNITGISMVIPPEKQLVHFRKILPRLKRVGLIYNPKNTGHLVARAVKAADRAGIELKTLKVNKQGDFPELLNSMKGNIDAYWMLPDSMIITPQSIEYLILFSMRNGTPVFTFSDKYLRMGAFLSLEINTFTMGKQAGEMARKILSGVSVAEIPGLDASDAILSVNQKVAQKLGISFSGEAITRTGASR